MDAAKIDPEAVCVCGHTWDEHSGLGNCALCFKCLEFRDKTLKRDEEDWEDEVY